MMRKNGERKDFHSAKEARNKQRRRRMSHGVCM
jgi:hypothetical protein